MYFIFQVFDSNANVDKPFRFKIGKGKVIKVRVLDELLFEYLHCSIKRFIPRNMLPH